MAGNKLYIVKIFIYFNQYNIKYLKITFNVILKSYIL